MAARHPLRILLAEDNVVNQKLALRLLQQMGYRADLASNGIEAVESVQRQTYDVVLMDVQMPELDGLDATRQICALLAPAQRPRIVAMTANAMQGDREMCMAAGMDDYLTKPIRVERLVEALQRACPHARTADMTDADDRRRDLRRAAGDAPAPTSSSELVETFLEEAPRDAAPSCATRSPRATPTRSAAPRIRSSPTPHLRRAGARRAGARAGARRPRRAAQRPSALDALERGIRARRRRAHGAARWLTCATARPACWSPTTTRSTACC